MFGYRVEPCRSVANPRCRARLVGISLGILAPFVKWYGMQVRQYYPWTGDASRIRRGRMVAVRHHVPERQYPTVDHCLSGQADLACCYL